MPSTSSKPSKASKPTSKASKSNSDSEPASQTTNQPTNLPSEAGEPVSLTTLYYRLRPPVPRILVVVVSAATAVATTLTEIYREGKGSLLGVPNQLKIGYV